MGLVWLGAGCRAEDDGVFNSLAERWILLVPGTRLVSGKQRALRLEMPRVTGSCIISLLYRILHLGQISSLCKGQERHMHAAKPRGQRTVLITHYFCGKAPALLEDKHKFVHSSLQQAFSEHLPQAWG